MSFLLTRRAPRGVAAGRVAVVTGAASGIGREVALALARRGLRLALADIDSEGLAQTAARCGIEPSTIRCDEVDVSDADETAAWSKSIEAQWGQADLVFNIAGVMFAGTVERSTIDQMRRVMDIDYWGVVNTTKAFLPLVVAADAGRIVNMSSAFGLISSPSFAAYNSAKFAVRGFTDSLRQELAVTAPQVAVTAVYPGGVRTPIMARCGAADGEDLSHHRYVFDRFLARTEPDVAAERIIRASDRGRRRVLIGADAHLADYLARTTGTGYERLMSIPRARVRRMDASVQTHALSTDDNDDLGPSRQVC